MPFRSYPPPRLGARDAGNRPEKSSRQVIRSLTQHTPAPWHMTSDLTGVIHRISGTNANGVTLVATCEKNLTNSRVENLTNALLITKAPELWAGAVKVVASAHQRLDTPENFVLVDKEEMLHLAQILNDLVEGDHEPATT